MHFCALPLLSQCCLEVRAQASPSSGTYLLRYTCSSRKFFEQSCAVISFSDMIFQHIDTIAVMDFPDVHKPHAFANSTADDFFPTIFK